MTQDTPSRKLDQYIIRFPHGMRDRLKEEAAAAGRSLNAEIVTRLASTLDPLRGYVPPSVAELAAYGAYDADETALDGADGGTPDVVDLAAIWEKLKIMERQIKAQGIVARSQLQMAELISGEGDRQILEAIDRLRDLVMLKPTR